MTTTLTSDSPAGAVRIERAPRSGHALAALGIGVGAFATLQSLLVPVLPLVQVDLLTDASGVAWTLTAWLITAAVATPLLGRVGDLIGRRRVFLLALGAIAVGSLVAALAPNLTVLLVGRVLQGVGGAIFPLGFGLVREIMPAGRVGSGIGVLSAIVSSGAGIGTALAGPLSTLVGWRGLFLVPLIGVLISALMVRRFVPAADERGSGRINVPAAILLSTWLVAALLPLSLAGSVGWTSPFILGSFAVAALALAGWIVVELRSSEPLVDMRMLRLPGVWNTNVAAILLGAAMFGVWAYFARFLQEPTSTGYGLGASVAESGLLMLPMLVLMAFAGLATGPLTKWIGLRTQLTIAAALVAASTAAIALVHETAFELALWAAVFGIGLGLANAATASIVVQSVPLNQTGVASGMNANFRTIGSAIGTAVTTAIVTGTSHGATSEPTEAGYTMGFLVLAGAALLAAVAAVAGRPRRRRRQPADETVVFEALAEA
ncbi:MFS transporter [Diaminobutyricimonas aerilata]|uniref:MFS transporter n=1 Tax=Diaminobutyricimonas aerilata TaxID=1162967 RepID=A0A2M9CFL9_9MICO|nr:MFS transporter [Diaminobutyricimonas aerilata]PJJ70713.1 MFS transporter [Diaminobutyricimonas aerilata]